ncbi:MAG: hypothetical protein LBI13_10990 [Streptococcaceae bacterium]|nr:hypothetical protein [Streptococcaceae bacterium]
MIVSLEVSEAVSQRLSEAARVKAAVSPNWMALPELGISSLAQAKPELVLTAR